MVVVVVQITGSTFAYYVEIFIYNMNVNTHASIYVLYHFTSMVTLKHTRLFVNMKLLFKHVHIISFISLYLSHSLHLKHKNKNPSSIIKNSNIENNLYD